MHSQDDDKTVLGGLTLDLYYSVNSEDGKQFMIEDELVIGRSKDCDIPIDDKRISRKHALLKINNSRLQIADLQSSNGTYVNGHKISSTTNLVNGDVISFEHHLFTVQIEMKQQKIEEAVEDDDHTAIADLSEEEFNLINQAAGNFEKPKQLRSESTKKDVDEKDIPASWIEESAAIDGTRMMGTKELRALRATDNPLTNINANITRLHCFIEGEDEEIIELPVTDSSLALGWELGRDNRCDIVLNHPSVSNRHAQIIHQNGRWKMVNLVSTNGILINGQKKLSSYLADGDKIGLGTVNLIFKTPKIVRNKNNYQPKTSRQKTNKSLIMPITFGLILVVLTSLIYFYVM
ncbi:MAG: FHA domain-containing protein [Alcanivoracaceae bacterium]|nr:FHA domain-containing protein [Alcanivoracaceae bacterium]